MIMSLPYTFHQDYQDDIQLQSRQVHPEFLLRTCLKVPILCAPIHSLFTLNHSSQSIPSFCKSIGLYPPLCLPGRKDCIPSTAKSVNSCVGRCCYLYHVLQSIFTFIISIEPLGEIVLLSWECRLGKG